MKSPKSHLLLTVSAKIFGDLPVLNKKLSKKTRLFSFYTNFFIIC